MRSYNVSLGIGGIKYTTAVKIRKDAMEYWWDYYENDAYKIKNDIITSSWLADNDTFNAKYATFLVSNILMRWKREWIDISNNPWVICTLYNLGNPTKKQPHENPQVWGAVIPIGKGKYTYGEIAVWIYQYLQFKDIP